MPRIASLFFALVLAGCAMPATQQATAPSASEAPLEGVWEITTTTKPASGCDFSGQALLHSTGGNVQYNVVIISDDRCPDGRSEHRDQFCSAFDTTVLLVQCWLRSHGDEPVGDEITMTRPRMQAPVDDMDGFLRLPDAETASGSLHALHWRRTAHTVPGVAE